VQGEVSAEAADTGSLDNREGRNNDRTRWGERASAMNEVGTSPADEPGIHDAAIDQMCGDANRMTLRTS